MIKFFKKYWLLILISIISVLFVVNKILETKQPPSIAPTPTNTNIATYKSIIPGSSTQDEVNAILGFPLKTDEIGGQTIAEYQSSNSYRNHILTFEKGTATLIKEMIISSDEKIASSIINEYGTAHYILYDQDPSAVFNLYVYPNNGIAYVGADDGTLLEIWYFKPTTLDQFISDWGEEYSKEKPVQKNPY